MSLPLLPSCARDYVQSERPGLDLREGEASKPSRAVAFDLAAASLGCLREALSGWNVDAINGATPASLAHNWDPGAADLLVVSAGFNWTVTLGLCRFLSFCTGYSSDARAWGDETFSPRVDFSAARPNAPLFVLVPPGQETLVWAALEAGACGCLVLPIDPEELSSMLVHVRAGNRPGWQTSNLDWARTDCDSHPKGG